MSRIQIRRGLKNNLPILQNGEPAFTTDTKELFMGSSDGINVLLSQPNANLFVNGNFLRLMTNLENGAVGLTVNSSAFAFGNFFFTNQASSSGNISVQRATDNSGKINIMAANASPTVEYREKYPRVLVNEGSYSYRAQYDSQKITLSFDYTNQNFIPINFQCGCLNELVSATLPANSSGRFTATFKYSSPFNAVPTYPVFNVIIFKCLTPYMSIVSLGNLKAELGTTATPFIADPLTLTSTLLERQYYERLFSSRVSYLTVNSLQFNIGDITNSTVYLPKVTMPYYKVYNIAGALQTGFTPTVTMNSATGLAEIVLNKTAHTLLDAYISGTIFVDNRPANALA